MSSAESKRVGKNFQGLINDIKRRPVDAAKDLGLSEQDILDIISGEKELTSDIVNKATQVWPVNARDFYLMQDDCPSGVKIMRAEESKASGRVMERNGSPYYEYRDTAMSSVGPFRPEWISELCYVDDNDANNEAVQWNNGHFMHQFTYFIGHVNFYYLDDEGKKQVAVMNTGDSMYITPFVPHTFTTRKGATEDGLILALTYGNKLLGDPQQELSALGTELGTQFALDFTSKEGASSDLLKFYKKAASMGTTELAKRSGLSEEDIIAFESAQKIPTQEQFIALADALTISARDLMPNDKKEPSTIVRKHEEGKQWSYPDQDPAYDIVELATTRDLPLSKALEISTKKTSADESYDLCVGLHQYAYNVGKTPLTLNWKMNDQTYSETIAPNDSFYIKPFVEHNIRGADGKALILRIGGRVAGEPQRELSFMPKHKIHRAISESTQWFSDKKKK